MTTGSTPNSAKSCAQERPLGHRSPDGLSGGTVTICIRKRVTELHSKLQRVPVADMASYILPSGFADAGTKEEPQNGFLAGQKWENWKAPRTWKMFHVEPEFYLEQMCARKWNLVYCQGFMPLPSPPSHLLMFQPLVSQNWEILSWQTLRYSEAVQVGPDPVVIFISKFEYLM